MQIQFEFSTKSTKFAGKIKDYRYDYLSDRGH